jgi:hypothetical protein
VFDPALNPDAQPISLPRHGWRAVESGVSMDPKSPVGNASAPSPLAPAQIETHAAVMEAHDDFEPQADSALQRWLHRTSIFLFVLLTAVSGVLLVILPWTPEWTDNYLLLSFPWIRDFFATGFFRGVCSGLGLLDIWIGFWEAFHYHERR